MPFDPLEYSQMLDQALTKPIEAAPLASPAQGVARAGTAPPLDNGMGDLSGRPSLERPKAPVGGTAAPVNKQVSNGKIETQPPFKIQYKKGALDGAKTINEVVDAMKPASQTKYMDWWESKYGSIQDKWAAMQQELGKRPEPERDFTRKEQFQMLMEFGMHLMRASGQGDPAPGSTALTNAYGGARARQEREVADYDQQAGLIAKGRADELKSIGTFGDALKVQSDIDLNAVQVEEALARTKKVESEAPDVQFADDGMMQWDPQRKAYAPLTIDGKRQTNLKVGSRGASAASRDSRPSEEKKFDHLTRLGLDKEAAMRIAYRQTSGDPRKDYQAIYKAALTSNFGDEKRAKSIADSYIAFAYPDEELDTKSHRITPAENDPLGLR